jgi:hypothetical protein
LNPLEPYANRPLEEICFKQQNLLIDSFNLDQKPYQRHSVFTTVDNQSRGVRVEVEGGPGCASVPNEFCQNSIVIGHQKLHDDNAGGGMTATDENNELSFGEASPCRFDSINNLNLETFRKDSRKPEEEVKKISQDHYT